MAAGIAARPAMPIAAVVAPPAPAFTGWGGVDLSDLDAGEAMDLPAGEWVQITRNLAPSAANYNLPAGPWRGFLFWREGLLRARALGDFYAFKFSYRITPTLRGANVRFAVRPGADPAFDFGPAPTMLTADGGVEDSGSITFYEQARSRFVSQGAQILIMLSCAGTLNEFSPEVLPLGYAP